MSTYSFTDRVRLVLSRARDEAFALNHDYIATEHILLGLVAQDDGVATEVLRRARIQGGEVRRVVMESVRPGRGVMPEKVAAKGLPYTSRSKKTLELAMAFARDYGHAFVGTEHLLMGLMGERKGIAAQVLNSLGLAGERADRLVREILGISARDPNEVPEPLLMGSSLGSLSAFEYWRELIDRRLPITIDDASTSSIYEQIVAQVREAVATGRLTEGERLPPVRRLADELDIAPGTVARAYGELERLGVVVTEGARGTRVAPRGKVAPPLTERAETLIGLLRPVAVAAFHLGATADEVRASLEPAMAGIFPADGAAQG
jgi:DNA-binding transcriptional regulator YhcF (GntR family)